MNTTNEEEGVEMEDAKQGWKLFLRNNTEFILPLDYIRDMAVEEPGDSPVLMAKFGNKGTVIRQLRKIETHGCTVKSC